MSIGSVVDAGVAQAVRGLSRLRGLRIFHPYGLAYTGTLRITQPVMSVADCQLLGAAASYSVILRFSRGIGLPQPLPDILGMALRLPNFYGNNQHQDLLFIASGTGPVLHHLLLFATGYIGRPFSSILPYRAGRQKVLFGILPPQPGVKGRGTDLQELRQLVTSHKLTYRLAITSLTGRWRPVGTITLHQELPAAASESIRFNPWNTGGGITPVGYLNRLRRNAYQASQQGRQET